MKFILTVLVVFVIAGCSASGGVKVGDKANSMAPKPQEKTTLMTMETKSIAGALKF